MRRTIVGILVALAAGCNSPTGPFQITAGTGSLRLANATEQAVYYVTIESETATRVDWIPCTNPSACAAVAPHGEKSVPYHDIMGYEPGDREAIVYWWHLEPVESGAFRADSIRARIVCLWPGA
jgi:hypothetical protein